LESKQNNLIKSLSEQPFIVLIRLEDNFFSSSRKRKNLLLKIERLCNYGVKNIEIGWDSNPGWVNLILEIKNKFNTINFGAASISSRESLESILSLDLNYSMSPFFNKELHYKAIEHNQLFIPGISNVENFREAINLGYKILKIFPASKLGVNFIKKLRNINQKNVFLIGAGGMKSNNLEEFLSCGYDALVLGRGLSDQLPDKDLSIWLKDH
tara:strand:- start:447 stop:1082 length:636 start_codon:yes stop_codon:yes gene_type:complete